MAGRYDFVYFDLDDTLLDHRTAERNALADLHAEFVQPVASNSLSVDQLQAEYHRQNVELWRRYSLAEITGDDLRHDRFAFLCTRYGIDRDAMVLSRRYMELYSRHWVPMEGAIEAFRDVSRRTRVGIITNGFAGTQHKKLDQFSILRDQSAAIVISEEFGHMKPSRLLFDHARSKADCEFGRVLYVGDSWHSDVEGGLAAGWDVAWYASADRIAAEPRANSTEGLFSFSEWRDLIHHIGAR